MKRLLDMLFFSFVVSTFIFLMLGFMCWSFEGGSIVYRTLFSVCVFCYMLFNALENLPYFYDIFTSKLKKMVNEL